MENRHSMLVSVTPTSKSKIPCRLFAFVILDQVPEYEIALRNFQEGTELVTDQSQAWNIR